MKYCSKCQMKVQNQLNNCPLCGQLLESVEFEIERDYPEQFAKKRRFSIRKSIIFLAMMIISFSFISGIFQDFQWNWVFIITAATLYLTISAILGSRVKRNIGPNILTQVIGISALSIIIDYFLGYSGWSLEIIFPLGLMAGTTIITVMILLNSKRFTDLVIYQLMFGLMGIVILAMIYFQVILFRQIAIIGSYYTIITCVGLFFFADRQMIHELKKKFHY
ncbi:hypothetical protein J0J80_07585 [Turicibacter bilis]|uniref:DUF6320 domain-containing protein n=1 Tax=Turicibacter bilis TaxID=2735723 RepID=UPI0006C69DE4|nr:DUF6320 domain-containing protein [Turicibacter bilis]MBS3203630.1 hypothetical protein [Turicibacter bilis]MDY4814947.1 DUF6320 domain-containing protein [Turicibacter bilis]UUF09912.1 hypothetical protein J0J80_07585 [Turicibacter bilis]CUN77082.1 Uncharacterised protein [Turicibacter sanguinis]